MSTHVSRFMSDCNIVLSFSLSVFYVLFVFLCVLLYVLCVLSVWDFMSSMGVAA